MFPPSEADVKIRNAFIEWYNGNSKAHYTMLIHLRRYVETLDKLNLGPNDE
jgi:hypothetical protein